MFERRFWGERGLFGGKGKKWVKKKKKNGFGGRKGGGGVKTK